MEVSPVSWDGDAFFDIKAVPPALLPHQEQALQWQLAPVASAGGLQAVHCCSYYYCPVGPPRDL